VLLANHYRILDLQFHNLQQLFSGIGDVVKLSDFDFESVAEESKDTWLKAVGIAAAGFVVGIGLASTASNFGRTYFKDPWQISLSKLAVFVGGLAGVIVTSRFPLASADWIKDADVGVPSGAVVNVLAGAGLGGIAIVLAKNIFATIIQHPFRAMAVVVAVSAALVVGDQRGWVNTNGVATQIVKLWNGSTKGMAGILEYETESAPLTPAAFGDGSGHAPLDRRGRSVDDLPPIRKPGLR
jgi:hypothetical protein